MWKHSRWGKFIKLGITSFFVLCIIAIFNSPKTNVPSPTAPETKPASQETPKPTNTPTPTSAPIPTQTPKPSEKMKIDVTSQVVKKVDGKHRYFFDIRNNDIKDFEGSVTITLYNDLYKSSLGSGTFDTNKPIEPGLGTSVHFDINTGPTSVHGEAGITKFKFVVKKDKQVVSEGEGYISSKYEDLDSF